MQYLTTKLQIGHWLASGGATIVISAQALGFIPESALLFTGLGLLLCLGLLTFTHVKLNRLNNHHTQLSNVLQHKLQTYREAVKTTPYALAIYDEKDVLLDCNSAYKTLHKTSFDKNPKILTYADLMRATAPEFVDKSEEDAWVAERIAAQHAGDGTAVDRLYPDGRWLRVSKHKMASNGVVGYGIDISDLKLRELQLKDAEKRYGALTQVAPVGIWQITDQGNTLFCNEALLNIFELNTQDHFEILDPLSLIQLYHGDELLPTKETQARLLRGKNSQHLEAALNIEHEKSLYIARSKLLESNDGESSYMLVILDVTQRKQAERDIRYLAEHDPLTGLANRSTLNMQLHHHLERENYFALVLLDLDHFKDVNDSLGHQIGDRLIKETAKRIQRTLRSGDFASRLGGDEFAVVLPGIESLKSAHSMLLRLYESFKEPVLIDGHVLQLSTSSGVAIYPDHGNNVQELIQHADIALYHQKKLGRGSFTLFETQLASEIQHRKELEQDLRRALNADNELSVNYQPQYHIDSASISGVEALVRWKNARTDKWISPADFVPIAEQSGLIYQLDKFVLQTAAKQVHKWHNAGYKGLVLASNLSTVHFRGDTLSTMINEVLAATGISPARLELEITEGLFLEEQSHATNQLSNFRKRGIRVAVDDFGTGYSNLGYLNNLPVDSLKIDRSFIDNFDKNDYYRSIVKFITELGNNLGLDIIAEGIETQDQLDALKKLHCSHGQGYFLARPQTAEAVEEILKTTPLTSAQKNTG